MATTSLWKVVKRMDHVINYAEEKSKTKNIEFKSNYEIIVDDLRDVINYAKNSNKTEKEYFVFSLLKGNISTSRSRIDSSWTICYCI